jgi:hypothetical protein
MVLFAILQWIENALQMGLRRVNTWILKLSFIAEAIPNFAFSKRGG